MKMGRVAATFGLLTALALGTTAKAALPPSTRSFRASAPVTEGCRQESESELRCAGVSMTAAGRILRYQLISVVPNYVEAIIISDHAVEWHLRGRQPGDIDIIVGTTNPDASQYKCSATSDDYNRVFIGRKDGGVAIYRFSMSVNGPTRMLIPDALSRLHGCQ